MVAGSKFDFEMIYTNYQMTEKEDTASVVNDLENLMEAMRLLEHNFLGKSGSRGYGQIQFLMTDPFWVTRDDYKSGSENYKNAVEKVKDSELKTLDKIDLSAIVARLK